MAHRDRDFLIIAPFFGNTSAN